MKGIPSLLLGIDHNCAGLGPEGRLRVRESMEVIARNDKSLIITK